MDKEIKLTKIEIANASKNLLSYYGKKIRKHDVRIRIILNERTKNAYNQDSIVDSIWRKVNQLKAN